MNDQDYIARKREEARKHYASWISTLKDGQATTPCVAGPRITRLLGLYYVDPLARVWENETAIPVGLVPLSEQTAVAVAVEYDLDAYGVTR